jgi:hypothetical protein
VEEKQLASLEVHVNAIHHQYLNVFIVPLLMWIRTKEDSSESDSEVTNNFQAYQLLCVGVNCYLFFTFSEVSSFQHNYGATFPQRQSYAIAGPSPVHSFTGVGPSSVQSNTIAGPSVSSYPNAVISPELFHFGFFVNAELFRCWSVVSTD